jgi:hypothetical protein
MLFITFRMILIELDLTNFESVASVTNCTINEASDKELHAWLKISKTGAVICQCFWNRCN